MQRNNRPVNLDLTQFKFPLAAIGSITHRITGVILFISFPVVLYGLGKALSSETNFLHIQEEWLKTPSIQFAVWICLCVLAYHFCAGVRHMLLDFGYFESIQSSQISTLVTFVTSFILSILAGVWVW